MTLAILHPSSFRDYAHFERSLNRLRAQGLPPLTRLLTMAPFSTQKLDPATTLAGRYAQAAGIPCAALRPLYPRDGRHAQQICCENLVRRADALVVFSDDRSRAMGHALDYARTRALQYVVALPMPLDSAPAAAAARPAGDSGCPPTASPLW